MFETISSAREKSTPIHRYIFMRIVICDFQGKDTKKYLLHLAARFNSNRKVFVGANNKESNQEFDHVSHKISTEYCQDAWDRTSVEGYTPVHIAAHYGNNAFIQYVLGIDDDGQKYICKPTQNGRKMNVLHICAEQSVPSSSENQKPGNTYVLAH
jgi:ankyrin repeat protein